MPGHDGDDNDAARKPDAPPRPSLGKERRHTKRRASQSPYTGVRKRRDAAKGSTSGARREDCACQDTEKRGTRPIELASLLASLAAAFAAAAGVWVNSWQANSAAGQLDVMNQQLTDERLSAAEASNAQAASAAREDRLVRTNEQLAKSSIDEINISRENSRAKIVPLGIDIPEAPVPGQDMPIKLVYRNTGSRPAADFAYYMETVSIPRRQGIIPTIVGPNNTCRLAQPHPGMSIDAEGVKDNWIDTSLQGRGISRDMVTGDIALVVRGCFGYRSDGTAHFEEFCYFAIRDGKRATANSTARCTDGNRSK